MGLRIEGEITDMDTGKVVKIRNIISKVRWNIVKCKFCDDSESVVKFGKTAKGVQRYLRSEPLRLDTLG